MGPDGSLDRIRDCRLGMHTAILARFLPVANIPPRQSDELGANTVNNWASVGASNIDASNKVQASSASHTPVKAMLRARLAVFLVAADTLALVAGFWGAGLVLFGSINTGSTNLALAALLPIYWLSAGFTRAYSGQAIIRRRYALERGLVALALALAIYAIIALSLPAQHAMPTILLGLSAAFCVICLTAARMAYVTHARTELDGALYSILEILDGSEVTDLTGNPVIHVTEFLDPHDPTPMGFHRLAQVLHGIDRVIVRCPADRREVWARILQGMNIQAEVTIPELHAVRPTGTAVYQGQPTLIVAQGPLKLTDRVLKRAFDLAFATLALTLLSPALMGVAIAIRLDSQGPILFRQPRIGRQNKIFEVLKFRSMSATQLDQRGDTSTARDDKRVTRVGKFIRKTSIDEFPQLINVFKGEMSIVGPRPHAIYSSTENRLLWEIDRRYWDRHACRPGITGLAQIKGLRGSMECEHDLIARVEADLEYLNSWSFGRDIWIILRTLRVLTHKNAF